MQFIFCVLFNGNNNSSLSTSLISSCSIPFTLNNLKLLYAIQYSACFVTYNSTFGFICKYNSNTLMRCRVYCSIEYIIRFHCMFVYPQFPGTFVQWEQKSVKRNYSCRKIQKNVYCGCGYSRYTNIRNLLIYCMLGLLFLL